MHHRQTFQSPALFDVLNLQSVFYGFLCCIIIIFYMRRVARSAEPIGGRERKLKERDPPMVSPGVEDLLLASVIKKSMFVVPELFDGISVHDFTNDHLMADLSEHFVFWQKHTRVLHYVTDHGPCIRRRSPFLQSTSGLTTSSGIQH
ncbi:hypothetical protein OH76DRAFT_25125 [Lentinus brumalis]|uniref:Uncharacterized protein n=1 Tax=Lentinus brumalis TaxID=2498619 RepID=A0A371DXI5_9APHY|nr:hypothetical protein OH76DRAFT_25125 [Polyporus brumalis]